MPETYSTAKSLISSVQNENPVEFQKTFNQEMSKRVLSGIQERKPYVAANLMKGSSDDK